MTLSQLTIQQRKRNKDGIKYTLDYLKSVMRKEQDESMRRALAKVGIELNNLLIR